jgi:AcrR family transcriptional regulator
MRSSRRERTAIRALTAVNVINAVYDTGGLCCNGFVTTTTPAQRRQARVREALVESALVRFERDGFDRTTIAEIADDADLSPRSFFRYFADKEEVLFPDDAALAAVLEGALAGSTSGADPVAPMMTALAAIAGHVDAEPRDRRVVRARVIASHPALQARQQLKLGRWQERARDGLMARGVAPPSASMAAGLALAIWREAYGRWLSQPRAEPPLARHVADVTAEATALLVRSSR